ncbi:MAG: hypothetical protein D6762_05155 [Candidatus Neomarinimicrobiota bacterium]|nr:MAG: hypothetical protein D6762_05155 [Candidatus Neomarinimicrobiota bacterium]
MTSKSSSHIVPMKTYLLVAAALFLLTAITVAVSFIPLGGFNVVVALLIAGTKASLVVLFFMHLFWDKKINLTVFFIAITFLVIFLTFTMFDTMTRGSVNPETRGPIHKEAVLYPNGETGTSAEQ